MERKAFHTMTVDGYLEALGSAAPAPGGGAAAGLLGAHRLRLGRAPALLAELDEKRPVARIAQQFKILQAAQGHLHRHPVAPLGVNC